MPSYKLTYFNAKARAESARLIFAYAGVPYEDVRLTGESWPAEKASGKYPWGSIPILEVDSKVLAQSGAITRYLGKQFNLAGENEFESAKCDELLEAAGDLGQALRPAIREADEEKKKELMAKLVADTIPKTLGKFNEILEKNGGLFVGKKISYADLSIFTFLQMFKENFDSANLFGNYPALVTHQEKISNIPKIKEWLDKRPVTKM